MTVLYRGRAVRRVPRVLWGVERGCFGFRDWFELTCVQADAGSRVQSSGSRVQGPGSRVQGSGSKVKVPESRVQGAGSRNQGSGLRVEG